jgi:hypothetical protein
MEKKKKAVRTICWTKEEDSDRELHSEASSLLNVRGSKGRADGVSYIFSVSGGCIQFAHEAVWGQSKRKKRGER